MKFSELKTIIDQIKITLMVTGVGIQSLDRSATFLMLQSIYQYETFNKTKPIPEVFERQIIRQLKLIPIELQNLTHVAATAFFIIKKEIHIAGIKHNFLVPNLKTPNRTHYKTFVIGNEPFFNDDSIYKYFDKKSPFGLVGTSGLRSIYYALDLGERNKCVPKVIIIDNSDCVFQFWNNLRNYVTQHVTERMFWENFAKFQSDNNHLTTHTHNLKSEDVTSHIHFIINSFGYDKFYKVIRYMNIYCESWASPALFHKIRNIFALIGVNNVVAYPSNIVACNYNHPDIQQAIINNIYLLNPTLCIYTDYSIQKNRPLNAKVIKLQNKNELGLALTASADLENDLSRVSTPKSEMELAFSGALDF